MTPIIGSCINNGDIGRILLQAAESPSRSIHGGTPGNRSGLPVTPHRQFIVTGVKKMKPPPTRESKNRLA